MAPSNVINKNGAAEICSGGDWKYFSAEKPGGIFSAKWCFSFPGVSFQDEKKAR
jgi:hypothetical protein